jgi:hypothetical protein
MSGKKQTAVGWLVERYFIQNGVLYGDEIIKAKEMEKQQIIEAFWNGDNIDCISEQNIKEFAEQYYNETYEQ